MWLSKYFICTTPLGWYGCWIICLIWFNKSSYRNTWLTLFIIITASKHRTYRSLFQQSCKCLFNSKGCYFECELFFKAICHRCSSAMRNAMHTILQSQIQRHTQLPERWLQLITEIVFLLKTCYIFANEKRDLITPLTKKESIIRYCWRAQYF